MKSFLSAILVKPELNYKLYLEYKDNTKGIVDIFHFANKAVFTSWNDVVDFKNVFINPENGAIAWNNLLEICPDTAYLKIKGISYDEWIKI